MPTINNLPIKLYADGADIATIRTLTAKPYIAGITTNPTLMRKAGVANYEAFACEVIAAVNGKPVSFEVLSDDIEEMRRQAMRIQSWAPNVFVKVPVCTTRGESCIRLITELSDSGVQVNVTAILTRHQFQAAAASLNPMVRGILSVFAGRIADTGMDPREVFASAVAQCDRHEELWASTREVYNILQAAQCGCSIITVPPDILAKAERFLGYNLNALTLDTVSMFVTDAAAAGYTLN